MGKPTGFLEYRRLAAPDRQPLERVKDWDEFHTFLAIEQQERQGARCMNCGIPFCHSGVLINSAASGCPIHNLIPEWNDLIYHGRWQEAWQRLMKTNNFPEFTGRVCPAPCEGACTVGINEPQVTIKANECAIIDKAWENGWMQPRPPLIRSGRSVAVVGSGPAGLACADQLNRAGHAVCVFERADRVGGLLMYGIPNMKLDKRLVERRVRLMTEEGVTFKTNCEVGRDLSMHDLRQSHDAIVLCGGATMPRDLDVPGRNLQGIHFAVDYLHANTRHLLDHGDAGRPPIDARGLDVVVIGGGDTGTDCVGTAIRQGCRSVTQLEIMPLPPEARLPHNPWPQWPAILRTDYGQEEAIAHFGADPRVWLTTAQSFSGDSSAHVTAVQTVSVRWEKNSQGRFVPIEEPGSEKSRPAQLVLLAMGFLGPEDTALTELQLSRDSRSNVLAAAGTYATSVEGIFAAGDMRRGQSLVVWAIQEGRGAARACDTWLSGSSLLPE
jgi:glutamate synthase (NADPH/NADH) small chain